MASGATGRHVREASRASGSWAMTGTDRSARGAGSGTMLGRAADELTVCTVIWGRGRGVRESHCGVGERHSAVAGYG